MWDQTHISASTPLTRLKLPVEELFTSLLPEVLLDKAQWFLTFEISEIVFEPFDGVLSTLSTVPCVSRNR